MNKTVQTLNVVSSLPFSSPVLILDILVQFAFRATAGLNAWPSGRPRYSKHKTNLFVVLLINVASNIYKHDK